MLAIKEKQIGDTLYRVELLGFREGRRVFVKLANILGPSLSRLELGKGPAAGTEALGALFGALQDEDLGYFEGVFSPRTTLRLPSGKEPLLRDAIELGHFDGKRFADFFKWLAFCFEANYADFLGEMMPLLKNGGVQGKSAKPEG